MNYYPHHIGDFRSGTVNMSRQSRWIYRDMLDIYYDTEKPLPLDLDVLCDMLGIEDDDERKIVERLLRFKFTQAEDGYRHDRCDEEIDAYHARAETAKANGKLGGRPKKANKTDDKPSGFQSDFDQEPSCPLEETGSKTNQEPRTKKEKKKTLSSADADCQAGFVRFWQSWPSTPRKVAKAECAKRWKARGLEAEADIIVAHVEAMKPTQQWRDGYEPAPLTYLNQRRWGDDIPPERQADGAPADPLAWLTTATGITTKGREFEIEQGPSEPFPVFKARVIRAANLSHEDMARARADYGVSI